MGASKLEAVDRIAVRTRKMADRRSVSNRRNELQGSKLPVPYSVFERAITRTVDDQNTLGSPTLGRQRERFLLNRFSNGAAADALNADFLCFGAATGDCRSDLLEVGAKLPARDTGYLGTDTAQIFRLTTRLNTIAHLRAFTTHITNASHDFVRFQSFRFRKFSAKKLATQYTNMRRLFNGIKSGCFQGNLCKLDGYCHPDLEHCQNWYANDIEPNTHALRFFNAPKPDGSRRASMILNGNSRNALADVRRRGQDGSNLWHALRRSARLLSQPVFTNLDGAFKWNQ